MLGLRVEGLGFRKRAAGCRVWGSRLKVTGIGISVFFLKLHSLNPKPQTLNP